MNGDEHVANRDKNELLKRLKTDAQVGTPIWEQQRMGIIVRCTEDIERSIKSFENTMEKNANASDKLAARVFWLNFILGVMSAIGVAFTVLQFFKR
jgi:hypothetical protein